MDKEVTNPIFLEYFKQYKYIQIAKNQYDESAWLLISDLRERIKEELAKHGLKSKDLYKDAVIKKDHCCDIQVVKEYGRIIKASNYKSGIGIVVGDYGYVEDWHRGIYLLAWFTKHSNAYENDVRSKVLPKINKCTEYRAVKYRYCEGFHYFYYFISPEDKGKIKTTYLRALANKMPKLFTKTDKMMKQLVRGV